jgi:NitT/TauT family transport system substrate-binding protein
MANKPKPAFYVAVFVVIAALVGIAIWRFGGGSKKKEAKISKDDLAKIKKGDAKNAEAPDGKTPTTVKDYQWEAAAKLPEVKGASDYKKLGKDRVVKFSINVWAGWAPIIHANEGFKPKKVWKDANGKPFKVELKLIDSPVAMRSAFINGDIHIGWATVDMLPLLLEGLQQDTRTMPRVYQQIDWSNGGDGIVVRNNIKTASDLRGKSIVLAQNSPSHFFILNTLINAGVQPGEVNFKFTKDAFQAAAAFNNEKSLSAAVSWAPDIYNLEKAKGNRMLVTTGQANKLIADVWYARADFAKDHKPIIEGLVRGIFDSMVALKNQDEKVKVSKWMSKGYALPESEALGMLGDAHWTNWAENREFFLNQNNPTNFERTYDTAVFLYRKIGQVRKPVDFDKIVDFSIIKKLGKDAKYKNQKDEYEVQFAPASATSVSAEQPEILTKTVKIHFFPNSHDIYKKVTKMIDGKQKEVAYDPNAKFVIDEIGKLAGQYGAARIVIEGHTDASMKGRVPASMVIELSTNRANAVKQAVLRKFKTLKPNQFSTQGVGWGRPADPKDANNHTKNRRVEIKVYPLEAPK